MEAIEVKTAAEGCNSANPAQMTGERYPYRQLENEYSFRLLLITPDSEWDFTYTLEHSELAKTPYKALSYEWGLPSDEDPNITIDGHPVRIRKNLHEALKQLKSTIPPLSSLTLWVDAICINQHDNAEKKPASPEDGGNLFRSGEGHCMDWARGKRQRLRDGNPQPSAGLAIPA